MEVRKILMAALAAMLASLAAVLPAQAHDRWRGGIFLHFGYPGPYHWELRYHYPLRYYHYPPRVYYYYPAPPPVVVAPPAPPTYIERDDDAALSAQWWYWCASAKGYYPYVKECPGGWQRVPPQPMN